MSELDFNAHVRTSAISNFVFNLLINGGLAWWILGGNSPLSPWSTPSYGPDLLVTGFLLCAIVSAIVIEISRRQALNGRAAPVPERWAPLSAASGRNRWALCAMAGGVGAALSVLVLLVCAVLAGSLTVAVYAGIKGVWAGLLAAAIVVPATVVGFARGEAERVTP